MPIDAPVHRTRLSWSWYFRLALAGDSAVSVGLPYHLRLPYMWRAWSPSFSDGCAISIVGDIGRSVQCKVGLPAASHSWDCNTGDTPAPGAFGRVFIESVTFGVGLSLVSFHFMRVKVYCASMVRDILPSNAPVRGTRLSWPWYSRLALAGGSARPTCAVVTGDVRPPCHFFAFPRERSRTLRGPLHMPFGCVHTTHFSRATTAP